MGDMGADGVMAGPAQGVSPEDVQATLARILDSKEFAQSERMRRFLRFVVERSLAGDRDALKEYTIGVEVFDRPADYDPRIDSIVRVEARRLRRKLRAFYEGPGANGAVAISLPEGAYAPVIGRAGDTSAASAPPDAANPAEEANAIVVLPFVNLSSEPENEFFADGLTDELINALSKASPLRVVSRTSAFQFKNQAQDVRAIGESLGVGRVLEGSVRRSGDALRVTAQLVNVKDGLHVWSERFDRKMEDIFALQEEIAGAIAGVLRVRLTQPPNEWRPNHVVPGVAVRHVLEGRHFLQRLTPASLRSALECFQRALNEDPSFAAAYAGLASALIQMSLFGDVSPVSVAPQARRCVNEALRLDDSIAWPHMCRGMLRAGIEWDFPGAEADYRRALEMNSSIPDTHYFYAVSVLTPLGRFDESLEQLKLALRLDPAALVTNTGMAMAYYLRGDNEAALEQFEHTLSLSPKYYGAHRMMSYALIRQGDCNEAVKLLESAQILAEGDPRLIAALAYAYARCGKRKKAEAIAGHLEASSQERYVSAYDRAIIQLGLEHFDRACELLHLAANEQECWLVYLNADPIFDPLREMEPFKKLTAQVFASVRA